MGGTDKVLGRDHFLWALGALCRLHRIPFDGALVVQQFPPPHTLAALLGAVRALGFRTDARSVSTGEIRRLEPPCLIVRADAPALVIGRDGENVTMLEPSSAAPRTLSVDHLGQQGDLWIARVSRPPESPGDADAPGVVARPFGFAWFVPELLRHRSVWRDVLAASAAIQLLGLGVPLLTQVIVDKVVVHQTVNTLAVIAAALMLAVVFTAVMGWVRQYLVLHTGNRVDAVLGMRVFEHLLQLPPRYFDRRPTGTLVARLQGLETIREFVSGAAVTLILDLPFLGLYLAVMFWYR